MELSHINEHGEASMVDVSDKEITLREAGACAIVNASEDTIKMIVNGLSKKGDILATARIAGINGAKKTSELIPLCHMIPIEKVEINFDIISNCEIMITSYAKCNYKTGIEMEALTGATCAALTIYDMCKAVDRSMSVKDIHLTRKSGGKSGSFTDKRITNLSYKPKRGEPSCNYERITLTAGKGIEGDIFADGGDMQISMISEVAEALLCIDSDNPCEKRFLPNLVFSGSNPRVGDKFRIGTAVIEITQVGRKCHGVCEASADGYRCPLVYNVIFAKTIESGDIELRDEMIYV